MVAPDADQPGILRNASLVRSDEAARESAVAGIPLDGFWAYAYNAAVEESGPCRDRNVAEEWPGCRGARCSSRQAYRPARLRKLS